MGVKKYTYELRCTVCGEYIQGDGRNSSLIWGDKSFSNQKVDAPVRMVHFE